MSQKQANGVYAACSLDRPSGCPIDDEVPIVYVVLMCLICMYIARLTDLMNALCFVRSHPNESNASAHIIHVDPLVILMLYTECNEPTQESAAIKTARSTNKFRERRGLTPTTW